MDKIRVLVQGEFQQTPICIADAVITIYKKNMFDAEHIYKYVKYEEPVEGYINTKAHYWYINAFLDVEKGTYRYKKAYSINIDGRYVYCPQNCFTIADDNISGRINEYMSAVIKVSDIRCHLNETIESDILFKTIVETLLEMNATNVALSNEMLNLMLDADDFDNIATYIPKGKEWRFHE